MEQKYTEKDYNKEFQGTTVEEKREDLIINPFFDSSKVKVASEEDIITVHKEYFIAFRNAIIEVLGEDDF